jgi:hypothetical protein
MRKLVRRIKKELQTAKHCAVYEDELKWCLAVRRQMPGSRDRAICSGPWGGVFVIIMMVSARFLIKSPEHVAIALQRSIFNEGQISHGMAL